MTVCIQVGDGSTALRTLFNWISRLYTLAILEKIGHWTLLGELRGGGRTAGKGGKRGGGLLEREGKEGGGLLEGWENKIVGGKKQIKSLHSLNYTHSYIPFTLLYILYYYILHMYTKTTCNNVKFPIKM